MVAHTTGTDVPADSDAPHLTPRERQVVALVVQGLTATQIGHRLTLSPRTVENHIIRVRRRHDLPNRAALVAFALDHGVVGRTGEVVAAPPAAVPQAVGFDVPTMPIRTGLRRVVAPAPAPLEDPPRRPTPRPRPPAPDPDADEADVVLDNLIDVLAADHDPDADDHGPDDDPDADPDDAADEPDGDGDEARPHDTALVLRAAVPPRPTRPPTGVVSADADRRHPRPRRGPGLPLFGTAMLLLVVAAVVFGVMWPDDPAAAPTGSAPTAPAAPPDPSIASAGPPPSTGAPPTSTRAKTSERARPTATASRRARPSTTPRATPRPTSRPPTTTPAPADDEDDPLRDDGDVLSTRQG